MTRSLEPGTAIARYRVVSRLGAGGMGEVYLARDESLDRSVALKILPPDLVRNDERVRRFVQEAKSASSLNHPHIVTIYEIGEAEIGGPDDAVQRIQFIAMELVSGHTLKTLIHEEKADLRTLVRYLAQAADGLAKAHAAGIVHRDLKPENIMVTSDGFAKVVDFGLAKLTESQAQAGASSAMTALGRPTDAGMVLGTVGYMSPEQVQGKTVDPRSDVFSLGCVLYEAATRQRPFQADSDVEAMHKILKDAPPPVDALNPNVPADLRRVIRRCLAKSPDRRIQSMKDVALDLAEIDETWETLSVSTGSGTTTSAIGAAATPRFRLLPIAAFVIGIAGLGFGSWQWFRSSTGSTPAAAGSLQVATIARIPDMLSALMSADGRFLAYTTNQAGRFSLSVRQLATSQDLVVLPPQEREILLRAFAPDNSYVYYTSRAVAFGRPALYRVPAVGGEPRRIVEDANGEAALSADGSRLVAVRENSTGLAIANADGTDPRTLVTVKDGRVAVPAWSPDGRYVVASVRAGASRERLTAFATADGREQTIGSADWAIHSIVWLAEGHAIVVGAGDLSAQGTQSQLWSVSWPGGNARRITSDTNNYAHPLALSADGQTITTTLVRSEGSVYTAPADRPAEAVPLPGDVPDPANFTPLWDGRLLYRTRVGGQRALWVMATDGSRRQRISPERLDVTAVFAAARADVIVLEAAEDLGETRRLWRMTASGGGLAELPGDNAVTISGLSADGAFLYYRKHSPGVQRQAMPLWRRPIAGGEEQRVADDGVAWFLPSPDGRLVVRSFIRELKADATYPIELVDAASGRILRTLSAPTNFAGVRWALSSDALLGVRRYPDNIPNIWRYPIDGGSGTQLTHFGPGQFGGNFTYTADGKLLFFRAERASGEVVQFRNFR